VRNNPGAMSRRTHASTLCLTLALAAAALAGCGSQAPVVVRGQTLHLRLDEFRILPGTVEIHAGRVQIVAHNFGVLTHNVTVELSKRDSNGNPVVLAKTPVLLPGASQSVNVSLGPGRYVLASSVAEQTDLGMTSTLVVY
jgi:hypothetical protein